MEGKGKDREKGEVGEGEWESPTTIGLEVAVVIQVQ